MIVCLCNALSDAQLASAVAQGARRPREVYAACDCKAQCGTCTHMILALIRDAAVVAVRSEPRAAGG
jgi:bacterioferritin-associated ferredoxin